jgi:NAD(P)H-dependent FMN reductase
MIDLHDVMLPMYDDSEEVKNATEWLDIKNTIEQADAYMFVAPEWNGMAPPALKNLLLYVGQSMAHKPYAICGVSSGRGGIHVIDELRLSGQKNTHLVVSPENLIASMVESMELSQNWDESSNDFWFKNRADYCMKILMAYGSALKHVRESGVVDHEHFPSGI